MVLVPEDSYGLALACGSTVQRQTSLPLLFFALPPQSPGLSLAVEPDHDLHVLRRGAVIVPCGDDALGTQHPHDVFGLLGLDLNHANPPCQKRQEGMNTQALTTAPTPDGREARTAWGGRGRAGVCDGAA